MSPSARGRFLGRLHLDLHRLVFLLRAAHDICNHIVGDLAQIQRLQGERDTPGFDPRNIEQVIDQDIQAFGIALDDIQEVRLVFVERTGRAHQQDIHITPMEVIGVRSSWLTVATNSDFKPVHFHFVGDIAEDGHSTQEFVLPDDRRQVHQDNASVLQADLFGIGVSC